ncbi:hypothetical protein [Janthinobacterium sp. GMG1]|uniref:hypothetical protein n=1 Tax=Janthinobacterium sp. GMG1 TaxID=3096007 RepID=UPI002ACAD9BE|nr:hypothetical protein [Janthinobacterium sp. GMG1]MDZ5631879.1 hypothetical protein [Janthinobacterium sp. GMG1]
MTRQEANKQFDIFADNANAVFNELLQADKRAPHLADKYSFYAIKGGAMGGVDKRLVEVFFGARPIDQVTVYGTNGTGFPAPRTTFITERGACLRYERTDSGSVICTLYPATTENQKQVEDFILYETIQNPASLNSKKTVTRHWNAFISYMECTNVDSRATFFDRMRIGWLKFHRPLIINAKSHRPRLNSAAGKIAGYVLTVGLSGFLLAMINYYLGSKDVDQLRDEQRANVQSIGRAQGFLEAQSNHIKQLQSQIAEIKRSPSEESKCSCNSTLRQNTGRK